MNRRQFLKFTAGTALIAALPGLVLGAEKPPDKRPNFIFILIDDMGWTDSGCYGSGFYETPNIDRLAAQGMRFTNAYAASPVCSPTRMSILAGKYPARVNLTEWIGPDEWHARGKLTPAEYIRQMPLEEVTMAEALKAAGYTTCFVGKWHLGNEAYYPEHQGFDINIGGLHYGWPPGGYFPPYENEKLKDGPEGEYLTDRLTDESLKFLHANRDKPFLLYLSHYAVHNPQQARQYLIEKYKTKAENLPAHTGPRFIPEEKNQARQVQDDPVYAAMIHSVDDSVGRIMNKLDDSGLADNTVVIFMSDNGGLSTAEGSPTSNVPLRAGKGWLYEGGIREPMIIKWPGVTKPGSICHEPVTSTDFYPTMLDIAGLPQQPNQHVDGLSLVPLLRKTGGIKRKALYWHSITSRMMSAKNMTSLQQCPKKLPNLEECFTSGKKPLTHTCPSQNRNKKWKN